MSNLDVQDIVKDYLERNGYDGIGCEHCSCELADLMPCGEPTPHCEAGYKVPCDCGEGCNYHIGSEKPEQAG